MKFNFRNIKENSLVHGKLPNLMMIILLSLIVCCSPEEEYPQYNPPLDHTISKDGVMHKSGLSDPALNCTACHGADLTGGSSQVSCYECHGEEW